MHDWNGWLIKKWLDAEKRTWYGKKTLMQNLISCTLDRLRTVLSTTDYETAVSSTQAKQTRLANLLREQKLSKLKTLIDNVPPPPSTGGPGKIRSCCCQLHNHCFP